MERKQLYSEIPDDLLGAFYIYIRNNIDKGINLDLMEDELKLIENESMIRNISNIKLRELGLDFIHNEKDLERKST